MSSAQLLPVAAVPGEGPMCEWQPASAHEAVEQLRAELEGQTAAAAATTDAGMAPPRPSQAAQQEVQDRAPVRIIRDPNPAFSAVAVDLRDNEVVMTDENNFTIMTYNRLENTPPSARMSEPKRVIQGMNAELEFSCSVYVDPLNGDIYSVNNDTLAYLTVFSHDAKGDVAPIRKLRIDAKPFGIAVDEKTGEMFLPTQDDHAVVVFKKTAQENDPPVRFLQGDQTQLGDPHGIALDPEARLMFVSNWGIGNRRPDPKEGQEKPTNRNAAYPGSGFISPASITVYREDASGNTAPLRVISGPNTGLNWPTALAFDPVHHELYAANDTGDSVTVYSEDAQGDAAPIRVLKGPKTIIRNPVGLAYDPKNEELWVSNFGSHSATVYKRTAAGDTAPIRIIRNAPLDTPAPMMGNPHTIAYDSKRDQILVAN